MKTPIHRRVAYITFIILFLIASPLIILYTMGYRYNFSKGRVQKTGILKITSIPRNATIKLNNQTYAKSQTPAKIEYLLPGDYEITLSKDGYYDWQKKLAVYENGTTFAEKVMLWKKTLPQNLNTSTAISWLVSPDQNIVAFSGIDNQISLLDINSGILGELSGGKIEQIGTIKNYDTITLNSFSPSGRYLLINSQKNKQQSYILLDTISKEFKPLPGKNYRSIHWDNGSDNLYALDASGIWQFDLSALNSKLISKKTDTNDFYISGKSQNNISQHGLNQENLGGGSFKDIKKIDCSNCHIKEIKNNKAFIINQDKEILSIVDLSGQNKTIELGYKNFSWLNGTSVIIYNDFEIYIFETNKNQPELITRVSQPIKSAIWHPKGRHLIFSSGNEIKIIELDNRELRNIINLASVNGSFLVSDRAGQNIFYSVDKSGIFKLNIQ